MALFEKQVR